MTPAAILGHLGAPSIGKLPPALTHDADKLIRQLSLVAYLMVEQRPITARDVKSNVEGYSAMGDEAFARRFFADRTELKGLGVPIGSNRDEFTGEELYNLHEEQYFLPPIDLSDDELAALQTSLHLLEGQFAYAEPLRLALQNLALGRAHPTLDPGPKTATVDLLGSLLLARGRAPPGKARAGDLEAAHGAVRLLDDRQRRGEAPDDQPVRTVGAERGLVHGRRRPRSRPRRPGPPPHVPGFADTW